AINVVAAVFAVCRLATAMGATRNERVLLTLAGLGFVPLAYALWQGQLSAVHLLALTEAVLALRAGAERKAGLWLLVGLLKPQTSVATVLGLLALRRWRALQSFAAGCGVLLTASWFAFGNWIPAYLSFMADFMNSTGPMRESVAAMYNWRAVVFGLLGTDRSPAALGLLGALSAFSLLAAAMICGPRAGRPRASWEVRLAVALLLGHLANPHAYLHALTVALVPGFMLWRAAAGPGTRRQMVRAVLAAAPFAAVVAPVWRSAGPLAIGPAYIVILLLVVGWAWPQLMEGAAVQADPVPAGSGPEWESDSQRDAPAAA
ncbi:MAG TPA: glycosyltransferase family 87 protein, partial [Chloroflexia bacterium]|nr:glycosyltransferase family 87 protein [Chloroflexia bacterium]